MVIAVVLVMEDDACGDGYSKDGSCDNSFDGGSDGDGKEEGTGMKMELVAGKKMEEKKRKR